MEFLRFLFHLIFFCTTHHIYFIGQFEGRKGVLKMKSFLTDDLWADSSKSFSGPKIGQLRISVKFQWHCRFLAVAVKNRIFVWGNIESFWWKCSRKVQQKKVNSHERKEFGRWKRKWHRMLFVVTPKMKEFSQSFLPRCSKNTEILPWLQHSRTFHSKLKTFDPNKRRGRPLPSKIVQFLRQVNKCGPISMRRPKPRKNRWNRTKRR